MIMYENLNMIECGGVSCYIVKGKNGDVLIDTGREQYRDHIGAECGVFFKAVQCSHNGKPP